MECPYCGWSLVDSEPEIVCSHCAFVIEYARFRGIIEQGSGVTSRGVGERQLKWQNLHDGWCPECGDFLYVDSTGRQEYQKCIRSECTFRISSSRVEEILEDKTHPANRFLKESEQQTT